jgi:hypothetical protein
MTARKKSPADIDSGQGSVRLKWWFKRAPAESDSLSGSQQKGGRGKAISAKIF